MTRTDVDTKKFTSLADFAPTLLKHKDPPVLQTVYQDAAGRDEVLISRYEKDGKKTPIPRFLRNGIPVIGQPRTSGRCLFRSPQIVAKKSATVLVVEGEKCAQCDLSRELMKKGWIVTTWQGGSGAVSKTDWSLLQGRNVLIWPDNDDAGFKSAREIKTLLPTAKIIIPPDILPEKGDIADLEWDVEAVELFLETAEELPDETLPAEVTTADQIYSELANKMGIVPATFANIFYIAEQDPKLANLCYLNVLTHGVTAEKTNADTVEEIDLWVKKYYSENYNCELSQAKATDVVTSIAYKNKRNPVIEYLESLPDPGGENPLHEFLKYYVFDAPEGIPFQIFEIFLTKMMINVVSIDRGFEYVNDVVPILEGKQGLGKSLTSRWLAGKEFHKEFSVHASLSDKDSLMQLAEKLIIEFSELAGMRKSEAESWKMFISKTRDRYRPPYGRGMVNIPRVCSFIGTTNESTYLNDPTGARRFFPLKIESIDLDFFFNAPLHDRLLSYYYKKALDIFSRDNCEKEMFRAVEESEELAEYLEQTRAEKYQSTLYDEKIENYIDLIESGDLSRLPGRMSTNDFSRTLNVSEAAEHIFGDLVKAPSTFSQTFAHIARRRGYSNEGRIQINGRRVRRWTPLEQKWTPPGEKMEEKDEIPF